MNTQKKWTIITGVIIVIVSVVVAWGLYYHQQESEKKKQQREKVQINNPVSYTHLTLPMNREV